MGQEKTDYIEQRNNELFRAYLNAYAVAPIPFTVDSIYQITVNTACSRFWISARNAYFTIYSIRNNNPIKLSKHKKELIANIMELCKDDYSKSNINSVIYHTAPKFFISPKSAQVIISKMRKCRK